MDRPLQSVSRTRTSTINSNWRQSWSWTKTTLLHWRWKDRWRKASRIWPTLIPAPWNKSSLLGIWIPIFIKRWIWLFQGRSLTISIIKERWRKRSLPSTEKLTLKLQMRKSPFTRRMLIWSNLSSVASYDFQIFILLFHCFRYVLIFVKLLKQHNKW